MSISICQGDPVPNGFIKVNDDWDPARCGHPGTFTANVWTLEEFVSAHVGSELSVCADAPTPAGWQDMAWSWDPTRCGRPATKTHNIKRIQRVE